MPDNKDIANFLGIGPTSSYPFLGDTDLNILNMIDSQGAYELAKFFVPQHPDKHHAGLLKLIDEAWAAQCLEEVNSPTTFTPAELREIFLKAPTGCRAQFRALELLREREDLG